MAYMHHQGCAQMPVDIERVTKALIGLGRNPNLHSVLLVSLGCESVVLQEVAEAIGAAGKGVETLVIQEEGGAARSVAKGQLLAQQMVAEASQARRVPCPLSDLVLGLKCGGSDTTQGLAATPALGVASDLLVAAGGTSILGEVTEIIGAEHLLARHARNKKVARAILAVVERMESRAKAVGCDMRGGQPTGGNIKGGLTTIEEKSLGAIAKAGNAPVEAVYEYGERPGVKGLVVMDSPGREPELLTGYGGGRREPDRLRNRPGRASGLPFRPGPQDHGQRADVAEPPGPHGSLRGRGDRRDGVAP